MLRLEDLDGLQCVEDGVYQLSDHVFDNQTFANLEFTPGSGETLVLQNVEFINCKTSPGTSRVTSGTKLTKVLFDNLDCGDALRVSAAVELNQVVVKGNKPAKLLIQPDDDDADFAVAMGNDVPFKVDVTDYSGETVVIGIPACSVVRDPSRHVVIRREHEAIITSPDSGLSTLSFWKIYLKKVKVFGCDEGVFSLPPSSHKKHGVVMKEKQKLENLGLCFD
ncbi:hypothetical protein [Stieleria varia]|uniref:Uncharacterized protein n=1 Tax=Stieleria varia TaxID=2528005 RepID=A0A5C6AX59_9BACT|nr:hypothetical protein [Stieleria varia]TWU04320.1 hypothetical protein Pla52n_23600 [Stieleria varia]